MLGGVKMSEQAGSNPQPLPHKMLCELDQGTIIQGIRSERYADTPCFGIIISARCDIANEKIHKLYYLVGVEAQVWFATNYGFSVLFKTKKEKAENELSQALARYNLETSSLLSFTDEEREIVINTNVPNEKQRIELKRKINDCLKYKMADSVEKRISIVSDNKGVLTTFMENVRQGREYHYYFLPEIAYVNQGSKSKGFIIDLQEIGYFSPSEVKAIKDGIVDRMEIPSDKLEYYRQKFWLDSPYEYSVATQIIKSPWCEHLMQSFSYGFIRIGLDGPTKEDLQTLINGIHPKEERDA